MSDVKMDAKGDASIQKPNRERAKFLVGATYGWRGTGEVISEEVMLVCGESRETAKNSKRRGLVWGLDSGLRMQVVEDSPDMEKLVLLREPVSEEVARSVLDAATIVMEAEAAIAGMVKRLESIEAQILDLAEVASPPEPPKPAPKGGTKATK